MIDFYSWSTPNGRKVSIMLEECKIDYNLSLLISSVAAARNIEGFANENLVYPASILKEISHMLK